MDCPSNPPAPAGYAVWQGAVPPQLSAWAASLLQTTSPIGTTWTRDYNGQAVIARAEYHTWTYQNGQLVTGVCIRGITLYQSIQSNAPPEKTNWGIVAFGAGVAAAIIAAFVAVVKISPSRPSSKRR